MAQQSTAEEAQPYIPPALILKKHLERWATNLSFECQAVELLTTHGTWLRDHQFITDCVYQPSNNEAAVDWVAITDFLDHHDNTSLYDTQVLLLAQQLAGLRTGSRPRRRLTPGELEPDILPLLSRAIGKESATYLLNSLIA